MWRCAADLFNKGALAALCALVCLLFVPLAGCTTTELTHDQSAQAASISPVSFARTAHRVPDEPLDVIRHGVSLTFDLYRSEITLPAEHSMQRHQALADLNAVQRGSTSITWIGHSTFLIRAHGLWILTDPVFSNSLSFVPPFGPSRLADLVITLEDLPEIDVILVSHDHYDHLDTHSLQRLANRFPTATALVPTGLERQLTQAGFGSVYALDWFERQSIGQVEFIATPAIHGSIQDGLSGNQQGWAGWAIHAPQSRLFFSGDTAYGAVFQTIRQRLGRFDIALVPIGAYAPEAREHARHTSPEDAVRLASDLGARTAIGMHWGTFALTPESPVEARDRFLAAQGSARPVTLQIGQTLVQ